jgi:hypothetical protein
MTITITTPEIFEDAGLLANNGNIAVTSQIKGIDNPMRSVSWKRELFLRW